MVLVVVITSPRAAEVKATSPVQLANVTPQAKVTSAGDVGGVIVTAAAAAADDDDDEEAGLLLLLLLLLEVLLLLLLLLLLVSTAAVEVEVGVLALITLPPCMAIVVRTLFVGSTNST